MAFGDRFKDWWGSWGDDDTVYEDESSFDDDLWADLGIDPDSDPDTWFDDPITPTDDPYGIGSLFDPPTGTVNPWDSFNTDYSGVGGGMPAEDDPYGIGAYFQNEIGDRGAPAVDFEDPDFNWGEFDVDSYLDSLLDPDYGGGTEGDPSDWFINSGDPATQDYSGVGGGGSPSVDPSTFDPSLFDELGYDPQSGSIEDWLQSILPTEDVDIWEDVRDKSGSIDPSLFTGSWDTWLNPPERGIFGGTAGPKIRDFFGGLFGKANKAVGTVGGGIGSLLNSPLGQLALLNYMRKKKKSDIHVPVGYGDGGGGGGDGSPIDYRVFNLQPALMPGVAYANVAPPVPPPEMRGGGLGDVTLAKLEPGEFVVTKKAVDNIGAQNLYRMMKQAEGGG
jgi:hypothetical protein